MNAIKKYGIPCIEIAMLCLFAFLFVDFFGDDFPLITKIIFLFSIALLVFNVIFNHFWLARLRMDGAASVENGDRNHSAAEYQTLRTYMVIAFTVLFISGFLIAVFMYK